MLWIALTSNHCSRRHNNGPRRGWFPLVFSLGLLPPDTLLYIPWSLFVVPLFSNHDFNRPRKDRIIGLSIGGDWKFILATMHTSVCVIYNFWNTIDPALSLVFLPIPLYTLFVVRLIAPPLSWTSVHENLFNWFYQKERRSDLFQIFHGDRRDNIIVRKGGNRRRLVLCANGCWRSGH